MYYLHDLHDLHGKKGFLCVSVPLWLIPERLVTFIAMGDYSPMKTVPDPVILIRRSILTLTIGRP